MSCLIAWWQAARCPLNYGYFSPIKNNGQVAYWNDYDVDFVKEDMSLIFHYAADGITYYEWACYGSLV